MQQEKPHIDQHALSRQLAVYGHETQGKLMAMRVFIHGLTGVGIQVAKNLIMAGPKQVTIYDRQTVTIEQLGHNFYLQESHVGKSTRAEASINELKDLNPNVTVTIIENDNIDYIINNFECVIILDNYNKQYLTDLNNACRKKKIGFILAGNLGLYGYTFVDFGDQHRVFDQTGEESKNIHIAAIAKEQEALVCLHEDKRHGLNDGDIVIFKEVKGMTQINDMEFEVKVKSPNSFTIGDTRAFTDYETGGIAIQVKKPVHFKFNSFEKSLRYPYAPQIKQLPICNWEKFGVPEQLHIILNAMYIYYQTNQRLPRPLNEEDAQSLYTIVKEYLSKQMEIEGEQNFKVESVDEQLAKNVARYATTQITPTCSFWGGIITQQVVKLTGKYSPLRQWLHHQFFQVLPSGTVSRTISHSRFSDYHILFGDEFVKKAGSSYSFLIGAGALGCEFIKMFALMGLSVNNGKIYCTDDDNIQISNLNRQFLFRKKHVGSNKSQVACQVGKKINPQTNFHSLKLRVSQQNEAVFNDDFWNSLTFIVNAVDNIKARQYIDTQCVWYEKPLFESGTLGTKCHSQVIIPHKTISYNDIIDPPEESIPLCTLKNFPYQIDHTIQWARDYFEGTFAESSAELFNYYEKKNQFIQQLVKQYKSNPTTLRVKLETLLKLYKANEKKSFEVCVDLGANIFQDIFYNQIAQLLNAFPANHIIQETNKPFWSGLKRAPAAIKLDLNDPLHLELVHAAANIYAFMFNIPLQPSGHVVKDIASKVKLIDFVPKKIKIQLDEKKKDQPQKVQLNEDDEKQVEALLAQLNKITPKQTSKPSRVEFEKDDPTNFHIEFIGGVSNLRARNYKIQEVDNFKIKLIAGKIIPAIATTTAMVVGAVGIEVIKYLLDKKYEDYKNVTINLALPLWVFNDPIPPIMNEDKQFDPIMCGPIKVIPGKYTKWDKIQIKTPMTIEDLKTHFEKTYNIQVSMITYGSSTVYSSFGAESKSRLPMKVTAAIESVTKKQFPKWKRIICVGISGNTHDGIDCMLPDVKLHI